MSSVRDRVDVVVISNSNPKPIKVSARMKTPRVKVKFK